MVITPVKTPRRADERGRVGTIQIPVQTAPERPTVTSSSPGECPPASPACRWISFGCLLVGLFMAILDIQIVSSSLADIQVGVAASADEISWVQTAYLIGEIIMIPLSGRLTQLLSTRLLFTLSAAGFTAMSLACAGATTFNQLVVFRALQGFVGGAMIPIVFAAGFRLFPPSRQTTVTVLIGLTATLAPTLGPALGGYITQLLSWRWLFLINLLPGLLVTSGIWWLLDLDRPDWSMRKRLDGWGLVFMAVFLGSVQTVLDWGPRYDWLEDETVCGLAALATVSGVLFLRRVLTAEQPLIELRVLWDRNFAIGCLLNLVLGLGLYGGDYLVTLYLLRVRDLNSLQIGEVMFVTGLFEVAGAPVAAWLARVLEPRIMLALGFALFAAAFHGMSGMTADWSLPELFWPQALRGFALMLCFVPATSLALGRLPARQIPNASALYSLMKNLGGAMGLAVINTGLNDRLALHWAQLAEQINPARSVVQERLESLTELLRDVIQGDPAVAALQTIAVLVRHQATVMAFNDCLLVIAGVFAGIVLLLPLVGAVPRAGTHQGTEADPEESMQKRGRLR
jgi:MFS transporter, DHA2 family, multidrug resistance protein